MSPPVPQPPGRATEIIESAAEWSRGLPAPVAPLSFALRAELDELSDRYMSYKSAGRTSEYFREERRLKEAFYEACAREDADPFREQQAIRVVLEAFGSQLPQLTDLRLVGDSYVSAVVGRLPPVEFAGVKSDSPSVTVAYIKWRTRRITATHPDSEPGLEEPWLTPGDLLGVTALLRGAVKLAARKVARRGAGSAFRFPWPRGKPLPGSRIRGTVDRGTEGIVSPPRARAPMGPPAPARVVRAGLAARIAAAAPGYSAKVRARVLGYVMNRQPKLATDDSTLKALAETFKRAGAEQGLRMHMRAASGELAVLEQLLAKSQVQGVRAIASGSRRSADFAVTLTTGEVRVFQVEVRTVTRAKRLARTRPRGVELPPASRGAAARARPDVEHSEQAIRDAYLAKLKRGQIEGRGVITVHLLYPPPSGRLLSEASRRTLDEALGRHPEVVELWLSVPTKAGRKLMRVDRNPGGLGLVDRVD